MFKIAVFAFGFGAIWTHVPPFNAWNLAVLNVKSVKPFEKPPRTSFVFVINFPLNLFKEVIKQLLHFFFIPYLQNCIIPLPEKVVEFCFHPASFSRGFQNERQGQAALLSFQNFLFFFLLHQ